MEEFGTGVITKLESGRFDNQYNVEITLLDGTKLNGFDGISVYEKKKDGSPSKVWPQVKDSFANGTAYSWKGAISKQSQTQGGPKLYAALTYAEGPQDSADGAGIGNDSGSSPPPAAAGTPAPSADHSSWGTPPSDDWAQSTASKDDTQNSIVASWGIKTAVQLLGIGATEPPSNDRLHRCAHELIVLKERIAQELGQ